MTLILQQQAVTISYYGIADLIVQVQSNIAYWDRAVLTDLRTENNKPDWKKREKQIYLLTLLLWTLATFRKPEAEQRSTMGVWIKGLWNVQEVINLGLVLEYLLMSLRKLNILQNVISRFQNSVLVATANNPTSLGGSWVWNESQGTS